MMIRGLVVVAAMYSGCAGGAITFERKAAEPVVKWLEGGRYV